MDRYIKYFNDHSEYLEYINSQDRILPNVSLCDSQNEVHYNPYIDPRIIVKYNVTSTSEATRLYNNTNGVVVTEMMIDGVALAEVVNQYTFDTTGEHEVRFTFENVQTVPDSAFKNCPSIVSAIIPDSVTTLGIMAFDNCEELTDVVIGNGVTAIGEYTFRTCASLESVKLGNNVTTIGQGVFISCDELKSVGKIGSGASVEMPDTVTSIGSDCFANDYGLRNVVLPANLTTIDSGAFLFCNRLSDVTIFEAITSIGENAFRSCSNLDGITIHATTPPTLGPSAFSSTNDCPIYVPAESVEAYKTAFNMTDRIEAIS